MQQGSSESPPPFSTTTQLPKAHPVANLPDTGISLGAIALGAACALALGVTLLVVALMRAR